MISRVLLAGLLAVGGASAFALTSGSAAPDFTLTDSNGKTHKLSESKGKVVVLEWFNKDCPYVRKHYDSKNMQKLQAEATGKGVEWYVVMSSASGKEGAIDAAAANKLKAERGIAATALLFDRDGKVGKLYGDKTTPHMFVIDKAGTLAYQGAIDDRPSASEKSLEGAQNYVSAALASLAKNEPVKTASTTPYGCSVKY